MSHSLQRLFQSTCFHNLPKLVVTPGSHVGCHETKLDPQDSILHNFLFTPQTSACCLERAHVRKAPSLVSVTALCFIISYAFNVFEVNPHGVPSDLGIGTHTCKSKTSKNCRLDRAIHETLVTLSCNSRPTWTHLQILARFPWLSTSACSALLEAFCLASHLAQRIQGRAVGLKALIVTC